MPSRDIDLQTIKEWRELGFHYLVNETERTWLLRGDRAGLRGFAKILREYAQDPRNKTISEHEHYGPYWYLKLITGKPVAISESGWVGMPEDFMHLASIIESYLGQPAQTAFVISQDFAPGTLFSIRFEIEKDGFDPSSIDGAIEHRL